MNNVKKSKILIIDDERMNIMALAQFLSSQHDVIVATNGSEGLEAAGKHLPDLILLDVIMPDLNGFDVIYKLKESDATKDIPVIFITGLANESNEEKGLMLGAADYITKPFHQAIVKKRIETHLRLAEYIRKEVRYG